MSQTAVGINVCTSACVQNVNVQNISVVNVNQAGTRPTSAVKPAPRRPVVRPRPVLAPPVPEGVAYLPPPATPEPPPVPGFGDPGRTPVATNQTPAVTLATRPTAVLTRAEEPSATASGGPESGGWVVQLALLGALLAAWISLLLVRRSTPASGMLTLDDGIAA